MAAGLQVEETSAEESSDEEESSEEEEEVPAQGTKRKAADTKPTKPTPAAANKADEESSEEEDSSEEEESDEEEDDEEVGWFSQMGQGAGQGSSQARALCQLNRPFSLRHPGYPSTPRPKAILDTLQATESPCEYETA